MIENTTTEPELKADSEGAPASLPTPDVTLEIYPIECDRADFLFYCLKKAEGIF